MIKTHLLGFLRFQMRHTSSVPKKKRVVFFGFVYAENYLIQVLLFSGKRQCQV